MSRWIASAGVVVATFALSTSAASCVSPEQDYQDYLSRTADAHSPPAAVDAGAADVGVLWAPDAGFSHQYLMACLSNLASGPNEAILFLSDVSFTPASGSGGTLDLSNQPLVIGATSLSQTVGVSASASPAKIDAHGSGAAVFGATVIPASANPINGQEVDFSSSTLTLEVRSEASICGNETGDVTKPVPTSITGTCIFRLVSGALPTFTQADFAPCP